MSLIAQDFKKSCDIIHGIIFLLELCDWPGVWAAGVPDNLRVNTRTSPSAWREKERGGVKTREIVQGHQILMYLILGV